MKSRPSRQVQRARSRTGLSTPRRQRGAPPQFGAVAMIALIISLLLGVNIGMLYYAQLDLQKQATLAAIAGAQVGSGCLNGGVPGTLAEVTAQVQQSLGLNPGTVTSAALTGINGLPAVRLGWVNSASGQSVTDDSNKTFTTPKDGQYHFVELTKPEGDSHMNAVQVNLTQLAPAILGGTFITGAPATLKASATAKQQALGSFYIGTTLASLNAQNAALLKPLLSALLCGGSASSSCVSQVGLVVGSYTGLVGANISLGNLLGAATSVDANITDLSSLLSTDLTLPQWLGILGSTLSNTVDGTTGQLSGGVAGLVTGLAGVADTSGSSFSLGSILNTAGLDLNPAVSGIVGAVPFVDGLDLLQALGEAALAGPGGTVRPITLPGLVDIPGVATINAYVSVGAPAKFAFGPAGSTSASTAEITLMIRISAGQAISGLQSLLNGVLNGVLGLLSLLGIQSSITALPPPLNIGIDVLIANAAANLNTLQCPSSGTPTPNAGISGDTAVATINVGPFNGASTATPTPLSSSNTYTYTLAELKISAGALGSTDTAITLGLSSVGVGVTPFTLQNITQFITPPTGNPLTYIAYGAPSYPAATNGDNPQTVGSNANLSLNLQLNTVQKSGSGLVGALLGLVASLVSAVEGVLDAVISLVNGLINAVIDPLLSLLGVQAGSATVIMDSVTVAPATVVTTALPTS